MGHDNAIFDSLYVQVNCNACSFDEFCMTAYDWLVHFFGTDSALPREAYMLIDNVINVYPQTFEFSTLIYMFTVQNSHWVVWLVVY